MASRWKKDKAGYSTFYYLESGVYYAQVEETREGEWEWGLDDEREDQGNPIESGVEKTLSAAKIAAEDALEDAIENDEYLEEMRDEMEER